MHSCSFRVKTNKRFSKYECILFRRRTAKVFGFLIRWFYSIIDFDSYVCVFVLYAVIGLCSALCLFCRLFRPARMYSRRNVVQYTLCTRPPCWRDCIFSRLYSCQFYFYECRFLSFEVHISSWLWNPWAWTQNEHSPSLWKWLEKRTRSHTAKHANPNTWTRKAIQTKECPMPTFTLKNVCVVRRRRCCFLQ